MNADLFVLLALSALLAFILWESWQNRRSALAKRARASTGLVPGGAAREVGFFVLATAFLLGGVLALFSPELSESMRRNQIFRLAESLFGPFTAGFLFMGAAVGALLVGFSVRKRRLSKLADVSSLGKKASAPQLPNAQLSLPHRPGQRSPTLVRERYSD